MLKMMKQKERESGGVYDSFTLQPFFLIDKLNAESIGRMCE